MRPFPKAPESYSCCLGVDLGEPQGHDVDFAALVEAGCSFAVLRASDGVHTVDPTFDANATRAMAEGLCALGYMVYEPYAVERAEAQATHALETIGGYPIDILAVDVELFGQRTGAEIAEGALRCCEVIRAAGKVPLLYLGKWVRDWIDAHDGVQGFHPALVRMGEELLWLPKYTGTYLDYPDAPAPWTGQPFLWQATGDHQDQQGRIISPNYATLPGMPREIVVDTNIFPGTLEDLQAFGRGGVGGSPVQRAP